MIGLSTDAKDKMLAIFAGNVFTLALFSGDDEIADALYSRREVQFTSAIGEGSTRYVQNTDIIRFEGFNNRHTVDHWGIVDLNGDLLARYPITRTPDSAGPLEVGPTMDCKFRPGELRIGLP